MIIAKKGHRLGGALHSHRWTLGLAAEVLRRRKSRQGSSVGVAVSAAQRARGRLELKPLEQGLVLHVVRPSVQGNREELVGKSFDYVPILQIVLAIPIRRQPKGRDVVNAIDAHEGIVEDLGHFVAQRRDVAEATPEYTRGDPTGVIHDIEPLEIAIT